MGDFLEAIWFEFGQVTAKYHLLIILLALIAHLCAHRERLFGKIEKMFGIITCEINSYSHVYDWALVTLLYGMGEIKLWGTNGHLLIRYYCTIIYA